MKKKDGPEGHLGVAIIGQGREIQKTCSTSNESQANRLVPTEPASEPSGSTDNKALKEEDLPQGILGISPTALLAKENLAFLWDDD